MERDLSIPISDRIDNYQLADEVCQTILGLTDSSEIQLYFDRFTPKFYRYLMDSRVGFLQPVQTLLKDNGYFVNGYYVKEFVKYLWDNDFPCGRVEYTENTQEGRLLKLTNNFILGKDKDIALAIWGESKQLKEYKKSPVMQICGPESSYIPLPHELKNKEEIGRLAFLLKEIGIPVRGHYSVRTTDVLDEDCPVTIFEYQGGFCYKVLDEKDLRIYLGGRKLALIKAGLLDIDDRYI